MKKIRLFYSPLGDTNCNDYSFDSISDFLYVLDDILDDDDRAFILIANEGIYGQLADIYVSESTNNIKRQITMLNDTNSLNDIDGEVRIAIHECKDIFEAYEYCNDLIG
jgi:hypothetical protein